MGEDETEKYTRNTMTRFKNQFSKGNGGKETPNTCTCYPEGLEQSDVMNTWRGRWLFWGQSSLWGLRGVGLSRRPLEKQRGAQKRQDQTTDSGEKPWPVPGRTVCPRSKGRVGQATRYRAAGDARAGLIVTVFLGKTICLEQRQCSAPILQPATQEQ